MVAHSVFMNKTIFPPCPKEEGRSLMQMGRRGERKQKPSLSMTSDNNCTVMKVLPNLVMVHAFTSHIAFKVFRCRYSIWTSVSLPFRPSLPPSFTLIRIRFSNRFFHSPESKTPATAVRRALTAITSYRDDDVPPPDTTILLNLQDILRRSPEYNELSEGERASLWTPTCAYRQSSIEQTTLSTLCGYCVALMQMIQRDGG